MNGWKKKTALAVVSVVAILVAIVVIRAIGVESQQRAVEPVDVEISDADGAIERLSEAIRHRTVSLVEPDDDVAPFLALREQLEEQFPAFHEAASRQLVNDLTLHFTIEGSDPHGQHVVFLAHQDVVPVEAETKEDWDYPPFSGAVEEGFVWGRGALDNKQNMMAMLEAAEVWLEEGGAPEHTLHFVFGHDEEIGGLEGAKAVAEQMESDSLDVVAVYDEGLVITLGLVPGIDEPVALVGITERGYLTVEIRASAEGGHSSMPPEELAVVRLARALEVIDENPRKAAIDGPTEMMFDAVISEMDFAHRLIFRNLWLFEPVILSQMTDSPSTNAAVRTTAAPTMLRASDTENVLPQQAVATVNFRLNPRDSIEEVVGDLQELVGSEHISVEPIGEMRSEPSPLARREGPGYEALETAFGEVFGDVALAPNMLVGASDSRHFTDLTRDVYRFTPVELDSRDLERIHGTNERIATDAYLDLIAYYDRLLRAW